MAEISGGPRGTASAPRPACTDLLEAVALAGATRAYVIVRPGKWDIPATLGDGSALGLDLAYLVVEDSPSVPHTLDRAQAHLGDAIVVMGFPDITFTPRSALRRTCGALEASGADVALACFPAHTTAEVDMVEISDGGRVRRIEVKPASTELTQAWLMAAWRPRFTAYLHERVADARETSSEGGELQLSDVLTEAIDDGLRVRAEVFPDGDYLDIGTPEGWQAARWD